MTDGSFSSVLLALLEQESKQKRIDEDATALRKLACQVYDKLKVSEDMNQVKIYAEMLMDIAVFKKLVVLHDEN